MKKEKRYRLTIFILSLLIITQGIFLLITVPKKQKVKKKAKPPQVTAVLKGKIAIVIDDWGYNLNNLSVLGRIKSPLTLSVLPNLPYSQTVAKEAGRMGFEIILHLPMEPRENFHLEKNTIMTAMDDTTIRNIVAGDLRNIPYLKGVSNHMGSKATEDLRVMKILFEELKKRGFFFLDSLVSTKSICSNLSKNMKIHFAKRDVFLDNIERTEYIKGQILKLKQKAKTLGQAIGIGHDREVTLQVLKEALPELEKEGYRLVFLSELTQRN